jgi:L-alanine-DL-glutamate epimerase-like enolase superfamily enzyme
VLGEVPVARAALEVACLDALARLDATPLFQWIESSDAAPPPLETDVTIPLLAPERMAALAQEWWARGVRALKVRVGRHLDCDLKALEAMVRGLQVMVGDRVEMRLVMTAAAHLATSLGGVDYADLDTAFLLKGEPFHGGYVATGARLTLPGAPGPGISLAGTEESWS